MKEEKNLIDIWMAYSKENSMCTKSLVWVIMLCHVIALGIVYEQTKDLKRNIATTIKE